MYMSHAYVLLFPLAWESDETGIVLNQLTNKQTILVAHSQTLCCKEIARQEDHSQENYISCFKQLLCTLDQIFLL